MTHAGKVFPQRRWSLVAFPQHPEPNGDASYELLSANCNDVRVLRWIGRRALRGFRGVTGAVE